MAAQQLSNFTLLRVELLELGDLLGGLGVLRLDSLVNRRHVLLDQFQFVVELLAQLRVDLQILVRLVVTQCIVDLLVEARALQIVFDHLVPDGLQTRAHLVTFVVADGEVQSNENNDQAEQGEQWNDDEHRLVKEHHLLERVMQLEVLNVLEESVAFAQHDHWSTDGVQIGVVLFVGQSFDGGVERRRIEFDVACVLRQNDADCDLFEQLVVVHVIDQTHLENVLVASERERSACHCR